MQNNFKNNLLNETIKAERLKKKRTESFLFKAELALGSFNPIELVNRSQLNPSWKPTLQLIYYFRLNYNKISSSVFRFWAGLFDDYWSGCISGWQVRENG
jgi:hypothetical protein